MTKTVAYHDGPQYQPEEDEDMRIRTRARAVAALAAMSGLLSLQGLAAAQADGEAMIDVAMPASLSAKAEMGARAYAAVCAECHGEAAGGREGKGPPLVHRIYEPGHHADEAFQRAVAHGVREHHWPFGDMAPVPGLTRADVAAITAWVRELQRANGIE